MVILNRLKTVWIVVVLAFCATDIQAQTKFCAALGFGISPQGSFNKEDTYNSRLVGLQFGFTSDLKPNCDLTYQLHMDLKQFTMNFIPRDKVLFGVFRHSTSTRVGGTGIGLGGRLNKKLGFGLDVYVGFNAFAQTINSLSSSGSVGPNDFSDTSGSRELFVSMHSQGPNFGYSLNTSLSAGFKLALSKRVYVLFGYEGFINPYHGGNDENYAKSWNSSTQKYDEISWSNQYDARLKYFTLGLLVEFYRADFQ